MGSISVMFMTRMQWLQGGMDQECIFRLSDESEDIMERIGNLGGSCNEPQLRLPLTHCCSSRATASCHLRTRHVKFSNHEAFMLRLVLKTSCVTVFDHIAQQVCVYGGGGLYPALETTRSYSTPRVPTHGVI